MEKTKAVILKPSACDKKHQENPSIFKVCK